MPINWSTPFHVVGFTPEGGVTPDKLYDRFDVRRRVVVAAGASLGAAPGAPIIIPSGVTVVQRGTAMGKITASGKWVPSTAGATDGSQVIRGIMLIDVDTTGADVEAVVGRVGRCNGAAVLFGVGHTLASVFDDCMARGIIFESIIG